MTNTYLGYIIIVKVVINIGIRYSKQATKFLEKQDNKSKTRIINAIEVIPYGIGDIKKLKGSNDKRLRVGDYPCYI